MNERLHNKLPSKILAKEKGVKLVNIRELAVLLEIWPSVIKQSELDYHLLSQKFGYDYKKIIFNLETSGFITKLSKNTFRANKTSLMLRKKYNSFQFGNVLIEAEKIYDLNDLFPLSAEA